MTGKLTFFLKTNLPALGFFILGISITYFVWKDAENARENNRHELFELRANQARHVLQERLDDYAQILRGSAALFYAADTVTRERWKIYTDRLNVDENYPGILGIGFAEYIPQDRLDDHITRVRAEGFPDYDIKPAGLRDEYTSIVFLEPMNWRNKRAFGFDMLSEPVRREAMESARDLGKPVFSGKVILIQEVDKNIQAGFLLYLPVYFGTPATIEERRKNLRGFVYSPFRSYDLLDAVFAGSFDDLDVKIFDGHSTSPDDLIYSKDRSRELPKDSGLVSVKSIELPKRLWTIHFRALPGFGSEDSKNQAYFILLTGFLTSLLVFFILWSVSSTRTRALAIAEKMTRMLRESQEHFQAVTETANDAIVSADSESRIIYFNKCAEGMFGRTASETIGKPLSLLMPDGYWPSHKAGVRRYLETGEKKLIGNIVEVEGKRSDGTLFPIEISLASWKTVKGTFFTAIIRDISERKRIQKELEAKTTELKKSNQELESFATVASHDLQEPLRTVSSYLQLFEKRYREKVDKEGKSFIEVAVNAAHRMKTLINNLLEYSRLNSGREFKKVNLNDVITHVLLSMRETIESKKAKVHLRSLPVIKANAFQMTQLFQNLIINGIKFAKKDVPPEITIGSKEHQDEYEFFVADNGIGIEAPYLSKIFEIFQRLHNMEEYPGTGIGLSICKKIVENHQGKIWAESEPGKGTVFYFTIRKFT
jgi:PAS domain S-box-containing protein